MLPFLQASLNNLIILINFALNELAYRFRVRNIVRLLINLLLKDFNRLRLIKREKINNVIAFTNIITKTRYNNIYKIININEELSVYLRLHHNYFIPNVNFKFFN